MLRVLRALWTFLTRLFGTEDEPGPGAGGAGRRGRGGRAYVPRRDTSPAPRPAPAPRPETGRPAPQVPPPKAPQGPPREAPGPAPRIPPAQIAPARPGPRIAAEQIVPGTFRDRARGRLVPFKMYMPAPPPRGAAPDPAPVVIFSHGLGGSRDAAPYLGHALARAGYFGVFIQHPGTDSSLLDGIETPQEIQARLAMAVMVPGNMLERFSDLPFVLDQLEKMNASSTLAGRLDLTRIGMIGHSYGARGTMAAAGQAFGFHGTRFKEPRIKVGVPLSPNVTVGPGQSLTGLYDAIDIPLLHVTGSGDGMMGDVDFDPLSRTIPYRTITAPDQYLLVLDGASHSTFSGRVDDGDGGEVQEVIALLVVLFLNAHLRGDAAARDELRRDFAYRLAPEDIFEFK